MFKPINHTLTPFLVNTDPTLGNTYVFTRFDSVYEKNALTLHMFKPINHTLTQLWVKTEQNWGQTHVFTRVDIKCINNPLTHV